MQNEHPQVLLERIQSSIPETTVDYVAQIFVELVVHGNFRKAKLFLEASESLIELGDLQSWILKLKYSPGIAEAFYLILLHPVMDLPSKPSEVTTAKATRESARNFWSVIES